MNRPVAKGMFYGGIGVVSFSLTLPFTRVVVAYWPPVFVGLARAVIAALLAGILLWIKRTPLPKSGQWQPLFGVALGVIIGFPVLSAWAMTRVPSSHGAVVLALLPLATAGLAAWRAGERPSRLFWVCSAGGCLILLWYAWHDSGLGGWSTADWALLGAVLSAAWGYAEGGKLSREMGGWQVISWALVLSFPMLIVPTVWMIVPGMMDVSLRVWGAFLYLAVVSQFLGFFFWYTGLAQGGIARVSQLQYLQPFFTILFSALMLGEMITWQTAIAALAVVLLVAFGKQAANSPSGQKVHRDADLG
ncbi:DMT family transporter [Polycladomyces subterraneus]|uniref:DMT family transporter n=1 Tax=Polycladomyces subterraneus TaxID=1016997 RepID=A0ABT8IKN9_9BACL|nr:DMT family transporter [Polycladomyces subterraneus]MDN4593355.1 DMT family transporter [Polycladomyces subterraneus]